ncbi:MAG: class I SAM-dependent methyltransferase [Anaerolineae bacterium]|nr:class I SAM-dependent methyltransferase [Anaerolineae bacterium]
MKDWIALWRELVEIKARSRKREANAETKVDVWCARAREFDESVKRRWARPDSSRDFVISQLDANATVLDIGAGTGAWAALLNRHVRWVTAVEPSSAMIEVMREKLAVEGCSNVETIQGVWPDVSVEPHDFSLCSHAMYGYPDLPAFIRHMVASTKRMCFLVLRAPAVDGLLAEAARHIWGQPHDSPNFTIAYNVLLQMGIYPNVLMENTGLWDSRTSGSLTEALHKTKQHFGLDGLTEHDDFLIDLLRRRLTYQDGQYVWPRGVRSALVYWTVTEDSCPNATSF